MAGKGKTAESSEGAARPRGRPFAKGQSGNPGGRKPIDPDVKAILKAATVPAALRLVELIDSPDDSVAFKASTEILNRELGKAVERHEHDVNVSDQAARLASAIARHTRATS